MKITISELRQIIIEEVEHEAQLEETYASESKGTSWPQSNPPGQTGAAAGSIPKK